MSEFAKKISVTSMYFVEIVLRFFGECAILLAYRR